MPVVVNLPVDPFQQAIDVPAYPLYAGEKVWAILPAAVILKMFIETFDDFPRASPLLGSIWRRCWLGFVQRHQAAR